jgi:hypothetical protein
VTWREGVTIAEVQGAMQICVSKLINLFYYKTDFPENHPACIKTSPITMSLWSDGGSVSYENASLRFVECIMRI